MARIDLDARRHIVDLGGTGSATAVLRQRWCEADIVGVDSADLMLDRALAALPDVLWENADLATWHPRIDQRKR